MQLLHDLQAKGIRLTGQGECLTVDAPRAALTDALRQAIRRHKQALLALLTQDTTPAPRNAPVRADVEERAAIYEFDGGMTPRAAELLAAHGYVVGLPACPHCNGMAYLYEDGFVRCTTPWCQDAGGADALE
jgi:hypothetical protein